MYTQFGRGMIYGGQRMMDGGLGLGGFGILAAIGFVIGIAVIALIIWAIVHKPTRSAASAGITPAPAVTSGDAALAIARDRLARGEIDPEQYTAIASALNGVPSAPPSV